MPITRSETGGYDLGRDAGDQASSTYKGRHIQVLESTMVHPSHADGFVDGKDPIVVVPSGNQGGIVGVTFTDATAATDWISVDTEGIWYLSVVASNDEGNSAVAYGDELFINTTTAILSKIRDVNTQRHFGYALGAVGSGSTAVVAVKIHWDPDDEAIVRVGDSTTRFASAVVGFRFQDYNYESSAATGDNRGMYLRLFFTGAGAGGGEACRIFTTIEDVRLGTAHGAHISLNFGDTGSLSGQGVAVRATLHIPNQAFTALPGTYAALQAEIWSDGDDSDPVGMTELSFIRVVNGGNANGIADVDDDGYLLTFSGGSTGAGNIVVASTTETNYSLSARCKLNGVDAFLMFASAAG